MDETVDKVEICEQKVAFAGFADVTERLEEIIVLKAITKKIENIKGVLIHGPSGIGKTMAIEQVLSKFQEQITVVKLQPSDLVKEEDQFKLVQKSFKTAAAADPSILLIEEIDFIAKNSKTGKDLFYGLLGEMDKFGGSLIIATTNKLDDLPKSMRRGGRLDIDIRMDMPTSTDRFGIFQVHLDSVGHSISEEDLRIISRATSGFVSSDLA